MKKAERKRRGNAVLCLFYVFMREDGTGPAPVVLKYLLKSAEALSTLGTCTRPEERKNNQME